MVEYKKEISLAALVGVIAALGVALLAITSVPTGCQNTPPATPRLLLGILSTEKVSCSLGTGVCNMTIVNSGTDSSYDVIAIDCSQSVILSSSGTNTTVHTVSGTAGGQATIGIPWGSRVVGTCSIPTSELTHQPAGSSAGGWFTVTLVNRFYCYPPGSEAIVGFGGTWI